MQIFQIIRHFMCIEKSRYLHGKCGAKLYLTVNEDGDGGGGGADFV